MRLLWNELDQRKRQAEPIATLPAISHEVIASVACANATLLATGAVTLQVSLSEVNGNPRATAAIWRGPELSAPSGMTRLVRNEREPWTSIVRALRDAGLLNAR